MQPAGLAEIERAKADGRWAAAYRQAGANTPDDLQAAIDLDASARAFWDSLGSTARYRFIFRLGNIKRAATRERRIGDYVAMLSQRQTLP